MSEPAVGPRNCPTLHVSITTNGVLVSPGANQFNPRVTAEIGQAVFNNPEEFGAWCVSWMREQLRIGKSGFEPTGEG